MFEAGHVEGATNIPFYSSVTPEGFFFLFIIVLLIYIFKRIITFIFFTSPGKVKNPQFVEQVTAFVGKEEEFIVVRIFTLFKVL